MDTKGNATLAGAGLQHQILFLLSLSLVFFLCNDEVMSCHREQDNPVKGGKENRGNKVINSTKVHIHVYRAPEDQIPSTSARKLVTKWHELPA